MVKAYNKKIYFRNYWLPTEDNSYLSYLSLIDTTGWLNETSMTTFFAVSSHINAENYNWNFTRWKYFITVGLWEYQNTIQISNIQIDIDLPAFSSYFGEVPPPTIATKFERNNISADAILPTTSCPKSKVYSVLLSHKKNILNLIQFYSSTCVNFFLTSQFFTIRNFLPRVSFWVNGSTL